MPTPPDESGVMRMASPATRDIPEVLRAIEIVKRELDFQASRFGTTVTPKSVQEANYHANVKQGYKNSSYWIQLLSRYLEGRGRNLIEQGSAALGDSGIDAQGKATPFIDEGR